MGAVFLLLFAGIGALHVRGARPLLMKLAGIVGCPMGKATATQVDTVRRNAVTGDIGASNAPSQPAFGFALGLTKLADVKAWQRRHNLSCEEAREGSFVKCLDVPAADLGNDASFGSLTEVAFGFSPQGALNAVSTLRSGLEPEAAMHLGQAVAMNNRLLLGPASKSAGSFSAASGTATASWRFADYSADVTVTQVPGSGSVLREQRLSTKWN
jgi:hypothetical protein